MFEPDPTPPTSTAPPRGPAPPRGTHTGLWTALAGVVAVACCVLPPLLASGVFAELAGIGVGGLAGGLVAIAVVIVAGVVLVRRKRTGSGCTVHGPGCGKDCGKP